MTVSAIPLMLCHLVYEDPVSHNMTLLGMFTSLKATKFPTPYRDISVYTLLAGEPGEFGQLVLQCIMEPTGEACHEERQRVQIGPRGKRHVHIRFGKLRFPEPWLYRFVLRFNEEEVAEQLIPILEAQ